MPGIKSNAARRGFFITFEGPEGSGKSTQIQLLDLLLRNRGRSTLLTREPGGTPLAEELRGLVKNFAGQETMHPETELLLMEAARAQHVREKILPALAKDWVVLCDRFIDSTAAYQGGARGIDAATVRHLNVFATAGRLPDLTILLDLPPETGFERTCRRAETRHEYDRFELEDAAFHLEVRRSYLEIAAREPGRVKIVRADREPETVHREIAEIVNTAL